MASLVKKGDTYGLIWTDSSRAQSQTRETLKTSNKRDANKLKVKLENQYWQGEHDPWKQKWYEAPSADDEVILFDAVEEFITHKTTARGEQGWNEKTAEREGYVMRKFIRFIGPEYLLGDITDNDLEDFYYRPKVTSDHTRNGDYISINTFLNWCITKEYIEEKPFYKPKKPQSKVPKFIYPGELAALIEYQLSIIHKGIRENETYFEIRAPFWVPLGWMILAGTGMRPVELANLRLSHVERGSVIIGEDFTTKVRAERRVPLLFESKSAVELLTNPSYREREPNLKKSAYLLGRKPDYAKKKLSEEFTHGWQSHFPEKAKRTLYNLKDMFAVRFISDDSVPTRSGMKLNDLKEILGHASLETTQKYLKAVPFGTSIEGTIWDYIPEKPWPEAQ